MTSAFGFGWQQRSFLHEYAESMIAGMSKSNNIKYFSLVHAALIYTNYPKHPLQKTLNLCNMRSKLSIFMGMLGLAKVSNLKITIQQKA